ncbi:hypothetical protein Tco_0899758, partial [Tanacetum coccineum]
NMERLEDTAYLCLKLHSTSTKEYLYTISRRKPYAVLNCKSWNILEYNNSGARTKKPQYAVKMKEPDITMEEYIQLETEKALRRGQVFNWETATYGKVRYFNHIDYFKNFETEFSAIVYKDASTSEPEASSEPTVTPKHVDFEISFSKSDDEDYTFIYDKDSFSYKLIYVDDLKSRKNDDDDIINVNLS